MRCFTTTRSKPGASMRQGEFVMSWLSTILAGTMVVGSLVSSALAYDFGRPATPEEIKLWDIDVLPDGRGLPEGSGTAAQGPSRRRAGHSPSDNPIKTVGSYWPYATTLFDYIRRAMPYQAPGSLGNDDTYAVVAYVLSLNGILPADGQLDRNTLPNIRRPNRDGFIPEAEFRNITNSSSVGPSN